AAMRKIVLSADFAENWNVSWKPLGLPAAVVTWTWSSASMTTRGAGIGTIGPMRRVIWIPLASIGHSRNAFGQGDAEHAARDLDQLVRPHRAIGVADPPELQWVAQVARRELVQPLAGRDPMLLEQREALRRRHEAPAHVRDIGPVGKPELRGLDPVVAAARGEERDLDRVRLEKCLDRIHQPIPPMPSAVKDPGVAFDASCSLVCR